MTTALSTSRTDSLAAIAKPVPLSGSLAYFVAGDKAIDGHMSTTIGTPGPADVAEAKRRLAEAEHQCRQATANTILVWVKRLAVLPWGPSGKEEAQIAFTAFGLALADLPESVFTTETSAIALRTFKRWPAPAEVHALLTEQARPFWRIRDGLRRVAGGSDAPQPDQAPQRTPEAQAYVSDLVNAFKAERTWNQTGATNPKNAIKPRPLSDGHLLAQYEALAQQGDRAAAVRVKMLRHRIEQGVNQ